MSKGDSSDSGAPAPLDMAVVKQALSSSSTAVRITHLRTIEDKLAQKCAQALLLFHCSINQLTVASKPLTAPQLQVSSRSFSEHTLSTQIGNPGCQCRSASLRLFRLVPTPIQSPRSLLPCVRKARNLALLLPMHSFSSNGAVCLCNISMPRSGTNLLPISS